MESPVQLHPLFLPSLCLLLLFFNPSVANSQITNLIADGRSFIDLGSFKGKDFVRVSGYSARVTKPDPSTPLDTSRIGVFMAPYDNSIENAKNNPSSCILESPKILTFFTLNSVSQTSSVTNTLTVTNTSEQYQIFFHNCEPKSYVTIDIYVDTYDQENISQQKSHQEMVSDFYANARIIMFTNALIYFLALIFWTWACLKNLFFSHKYHAWMAAFLLAGCLNSICVLLRIGGYFYFNESKILPDFCTLIRGFFYTLACGLVVIACSILKPCLTNLEYFVLIILISIQAFANALYNIKREIGASFFNPVGNWDIGLMGCDMGCCVLIMGLFLVAYAKMKKVSTVQQFAARNLDRLRVFGLLYLGLVVYKVLVVGLVVFRANVSIKFWWHSVAIEKEIGLLCYLLIYAVFAPTESNFCAFLEEKKQAGSLVLPTNIYG